MDPTKAAPFELGRGEDAVLLVHGFTGTPWEVRPLGEALAQRGYHVRALRLPGHGQTPEAMLDVTWRDWERAVFGALDDLSAHRDVFVAGLSMGALLSVILAAERPGRVRALALLAPALRFRDPTTQLLRALRRPRLLHLLRPWVHKQASDIADPEALKDAPVLHRWPTVRLYDFFTVQDRARQAMSKVKPPALVIASQHDHVVSTEGAKELARGLVASEAVRFLQLEQGFHIIPRDFAKAQVEREVGEFFEQFRRRGHGEKDEVRAGH